MYGEPYWCEDAYYKLTLAQVEKLEEVTAELHQMCLKVVEKVIASDELMTKFQGQGIMKEAADEALKYGFEELHFHSIEAVIDPRNNASERILQKRLKVRLQLQQHKYIWLPTTRGV